LIGSTVQRIGSGTTCLGDGHDGIWNIINHLALNTQRPEVLDWFHLIENLHVDGSLKRLNQAETLLWQGQVEAALALLADTKLKQAFTSLRMGTETKPLLCKQRLDQFVAIITRFPTVFGESDYTISLNTFYLSRDASTKYSCLNKYSLDGKRVILLFIAPMYLGRGTGCFNCCEWF
jgi:hypothetical protein